MIFLLNFTPFSFVFYIFYIFSLGSLLSVSDFYIFWVVIELAILFFIGICYSTFTVGFSRLIVYFLIQTLASFSLFVFYLLNCPSLFTLSLLLKLSMFPFHSWFLSVVYRFSNFSFFISSTLHKLPPFLMLALFISNPSSISILLVSRVLTVLLSGGTMLITSDIRLLLLTSSVGNNSWFVLARISSASLFVLFLSVYSLVLIVTLSLLKAGSYFTSTFSPDTPTHLSICLLLLSGLPPSPLFIFKLFVVYSLIYLVPLRVLLLFLLSRSIILAGYIRIVFSYLSLCFSSSISL